MIEQIHTEFRHPADEFTPMPFWFWNDYNEYPVIPVFTSRIDRRKAEITLQQKNGVMIMVKKVVVLLVLLSIAVMFVIPINADPTDTVLDQQVTLAVPAEFELVDSDKDHRAEAVKVKIRINSYREGDFIVTGKLEGMQDGSWTEMGTSVIPFRWSPDNDTAEIMFYPDLIRQNRVSGPFRASISLKEDDWELPQQVVGFSPKYAWDAFEVERRIASAEKITAPAQAKRVAEAWAGLKSIKLGKLLKIRFIYDRWHLDYQNKRPGGILRFVISPQGQVDLLKIKPLAEN
jgi:hypothetical protein